MLRLRPLAHSTTAGFVSRDNLTESLTEPGCCPAQYQAIHFPQSQTYSSTPQNRPSPLRVKWLPSVGPKHPKEASKPRDPDNVYVINKGKMENVPTLGIQYQTSFERHHVAFTISYQKFLSVRKTETLTRSEMNHSSCYLLINQTR